MAQSLETVAATIEGAAQAWTSSLSERAIAERAVPVSRLIRNAGDQSADLEEIFKGLSALEDRGLNADAQSALGLDNVSDIRQVRRLLSASNADLVELSSLIGQRDANAEAIAQRQQRAETQATIVAAIVQAANILGVDISPERAQQLSATFVLPSGEVVGGELPSNFIDQLLNSGQIVRT